MSPASSAVDLSETSIAFPPLLISDASIPPPAIIQTTTTLAPIYTISLILTAMLSLGALVIVLTKGEKRLWKRLFSKYECHDDIERTGEARKKPILCFQRVYEDERREPVPCVKQTYSVPKPATRLRVYSTDLHPIAEEDEDIGKEEVVAVETVYATGMEHPSGSMSSLGSLSSSSSFKSEEDLTETEIHSQSVARRVRRRADPMEVLQCSKAKLVSRSISAPDFLKLGWELVGEEKVAGSFEVKRAVSQNMEMAKGQLVSLGWPSSGLVHNIAVSAGDSSGGSSSELNSLAGGDLSRSTLSSIPESDVKLSMRA